MIGATSSEGFYIIVNDKLGPHLRSFITAKDMFVTINKRYGFNVIENRRKRIIRKAHSTLYEEL